MFLITFLKKHFDVEAQTNFDETIDGTNNSGKDVYQLWVYEKGQDSEPLFILKDAKALIGVEGWVVGNVYSKLQHGLLVSDSQVKMLVKNSQIIG